MRSMSVKIYILAVLMVLNIPNLGFAQKDGEEIVKVIGKFRTIHSKVLKEDRMVVVYTPNDYNVSQKKYPVLFFFDAENRERIFRSMLTVEFFNIFGQVPEMVVVGILNTNRYRDLTPLPVKGVQGSGGGDNFLTFITDELIPFIDKNYRTMNNRILYGGSAAGLFVIYTMIKKPEFFNAYISSSPSLSSSIYEWDSESIFQQVKEVLGKYKSFNKFLYMNYGSVENPNKPIQRLASIIKDNAPEDFRWELKVVEGEGHVPFTSLLDGLLALYSDWKLPRGFLSIKGHENIKNHLEKLSKKRGYHIGIEDILSEREINELAYLLLRADKVKEAIKYFILNVNVFPGSANAYDSLGEAYMKDGQKELAIKNYKKSLKLNPKNTNAVEMLKKLKSEK